MRLFGKSGLNQSQTKPLKAEKPPSKKAKTNPLKDAIRDAVQSRSGEASKSPETTPEKPQKTASSSETINQPVREKTPAPSPTLPSIQFRPIQLGKAIVAVAEFSVSWMPFIAALGLTFLVLRNVTDNFAAFAVGNEALDGQTQEEVTPLNPPIIYEKGLEPFSSEDDRIPVEALSDEYELNDPMLARKLTGVGVLYTNGGRCTANVLGRRDFLITASHCVVGASEETPNDGYFEFYSPVCNEWYSDTRMFVRTNDFLMRTDLDYAILKLDTPVCDASVPFQAVTMSDETALELKTRNHPILLISVQPLRDIRRVNEFPKEQEAAKSRYDGLTVLGVFGRFSKRYSNVGSQDGSLTYYIDGVDAFSGASGGAALISLDYGKTYQILGTMFGHREKDGTGIYPRIRGEYAQHIEEFFSEWDDDPELEGM